jgi:hypothetical protein
LVDVSLPLTRTVNFRAVLQKGHRFQVPRLIRWEFKMEPSQVLRVSVGLANGYHDEDFFGKMNRDGRLTIPKLTLDLLQDRLDGKSLVGCALKVQLSPV